MSPEEFQRMRERQVAMIRFDYLFRSAWYSIARERGYRYDAFLASTSHGTIAIRSHLAANGV
jgi:hypothetical protein